MPLIEPLTAQPKIVFWASGQESRQVLRLCSGCSPSHRGGDDTLREPEIRVRELPSLETEIHLHLIVTATHSGESSDVGAATNSLDLQQVSQLRRDERYGSTGVEQIPGALLRSIRLDRNECSLGKRELVHDSSVGAEELHAMRLQLIVRRRI